MKGWLVTIFLWAFLKVEQCWCDILRPINVDIKFCSESEELDNIMHQYLVRE